MQGAPQLAGGDVFANIAAGAVLGAVGGGGGGASSAMLLRADGSVMQPLDEQTVRDAAAKFGELGVATVAVCFLHAYANPAHEQRAAEILRDRMPDIPVFTSAEVLPEHREYERFATTALNAYVGPGMAGYLHRLKQRLDEGNLSVSPEIMSSSGGSWSFERMASLPVNSMLSGPAGGVIGAVEVCRKMAAKDLITYDMGGTSTDVAMVRDGRYALSMEGSIAELPNRVAQIEINTVGAGGGSIAYLDEGGFLNVGPRSAGADPGPACYGRGGTEHDSPVDEQPETHRPIRTNTQAPPRRSRAARAPARRPSPSS